jgi:poly(3-hydroxybutyrate) depolymerase
MTRQTSRQQPFDSAQRAAKCSIGLERLELRSMPAALPLGPPPPAAAGPSIEVRSFDGTGNNVAHPDWGSTAEQLLRRSVPAYADGISAPSGTDRPSARVVSNLLAANPAGGVINDRDWTAFVYAWGQFLDHDLGLTDTASPRERLSIAVPAGDSSFDPAGSGTMTISMSRSAYDPTTGLGAGNPRQQTNSITAFIDGSQVYGSDATRAAALRTFTGGLMRTSAGGLLPFNTAGLANANDAHRVADSALFLVAYPDASDGGFGLYPSDWNAGNCCGGAYRNNVDDLAFLTAVISAMSAHVPVDPKRIYVAGFSAGGRMAYHAGCQLSGTFASIAVVSGSLVDQACAPNNPMPMIAFHGTDDPEVSYDEPAPTPPTAVPAAAAPMPPSARFWVGRYRCTSGTPSLISTYTTRIRFTACATGTDIDFYKIQGGTHGWPGGPDAPGNLPPMNEIRASFLIWQFFARHTHK